MQKCWYKIEDEIFSDIYDETVELYNYICENEYDGSIQKLFIGYTVSEEWIRKRGFDKIAKLYEKIPHLETTRFMSTDENDTSHGFPKKEYLPHIDSDHKSSRYSAGIVLPLFGATKDTVTSWYRIKEGSMNFDVRYTSYAYDPDKVKTEKIDEAILENGVPYLLNVQQLHGVKNESGLKRVNAGWHFKRYFTWEDILEYLDGKLYRSHQAISLNNVKKIVEKTKLEDKQYLNTVVKNRGMKFDTYVKISKHKETLDFAVDYLENKRPDLLIEHGYHDEKYYIQTGEISGPKLDDYAKAFNIRNSTNATLCLKTSFLYKLAEALRDAYDRSLPFVHRDPNAHNIIVTNTENLKVEFIDFDSFKRVDNPLEIFYNEMYSLFKPYTGWDVELTKEICDVYFK